jgi:hypothetical protein
VPKYKLKGAFWFPQVFPDDITNASPPAWHKDLSNIVSTKAAVAHMTTGVSIERFIYDSADPFEFMIRAKCDRASQLWIGDQQTQRIIRYFVSREGGALRKVSPPTGVAGEYKRRSGISDHEYYSIKQTLAAGVHDPRIHTKNKSVHQTRETGICSGFLVTDCSRASDFDFNALNYEFYIREAEKLVVK